MWSSDPDSANRSRTLSAPDLVQAPEPPSARVGELRPIAERLLDARRVVLTTPQLQRRLCAKAEGTHLLERLQRA